MTNALGYPQYTQVSMELWLDENNWLYKTEQVFRKLSAITGMADNLTAVIKEQTNQKYKPY
jgi:hypothetical protein